MKNLRNILLIENIIGKSLIKLFHLRLLKYFCNISGKYFSNVLFCCETVPPSLKPVCLSCSLWICALTVTFPKLFLVFCKKWAQTAIISSVDVLIRETQFKTLEHLNSMELNIFEILGKIFEHMLLGRRQIIWIFVHTQKQSMLALIGLVAKLLIVTAREWKFLCVRLQKRIARMIQVLRIKFGSLSSCVSVKENNTEYFECEHWKACTHAWGNFLNFF